MPVKWHRFFKNFLIVNLKLIIYGCFVKKNKNETETVDVLNKIIIRR